MFRMEKKRRSGDRVVIHTPSEIVRCQFDGGLIVAHCSGTNARRALERKGFKVVSEVAEKPKPKPKAKAKRARDEDGHFKADDPSTPNVNEAWSPPKKVRS